MLLHIFYWHALELYSPVWYSENFSQTNQALGTAGVHFVCPVGAEILTLIRFVTVYVVLHAIWRSKWIRSRKAVRIRQPAESEQYRNKQGRKLSLLKLQQYGCQKNKSLIKKSILQIFFVNVQRMEISWVFIFLQPVFHDHIIRNWVLQRSK